MKKLYFLFFAIVMSMVSFVASAADLTLTVKVNDPDLVKVQAYYYSGGSKTVDLTFDESNECVVEYPAGCMIMQLRMTAVTPSGSNPVYLKKYTFFDCDGNVLKTESPNTTSQKSISLNSTYDGGSVEIECGELADKKLNVHVEGDPAKFTMNAYGVPVSVVAGDQQVNVAPDAQYLMIKPVGVQSLYKVLYNDVEQPLKEDGMEGQSSYYYSISPIADGDNLAIYTDYPDVDCTVNLECNDPNFIKSVTVNNVAVEANWPLTVKSGDYVVVKGDTYGYNVNSCGLNDQTFDWPSSSLSSIVTEATTFRFNVTKIERSGAFTVYVQEGVGLTVSTDEGKFAELNSGYNTLELEPDTDNPFVLNITQFPEGVSDSAMPYIFVNGEAIEEAGFYTDVTIKNGDVIKVYIAESAPEAHSISYTLENMSGTPVIMHDEVIVISEPGTHSVLPGTSVKIKAAEGQTISSVTVNGEALEAVEGVYSFNAGDVDYAVTIAGAAATGRLVTFKANFPDGVYLRYADDYEFAATEEGAVYNLDDYEAEWGESLVVYTKEGYSLNSFLYNGDEVMGNEDYDWGGGMFYFGQIQGGDSFEFTLEKLEVKEGTLKVFVSGLDNTDGIYLANNYGMEFVEENLPEGYSDVTFTSLQTPLLLGVKSFKGSMSNDNVFVYLNNERVNYDYGWSIDCQDGDVLKIYVAASAPVAHNITYTINGIEGVPVIKHDIVNVIEEPGTHTVLPGTAVSIQATEGQTIGYVSVNGTALEAVEDVYTFTAGNEDCEVVIAQNAPSTGRLVTFKANIPEGVYLSYSDDYVFEATEEGAVYNLDDYDAEWGDFLVVYTVNGYNIKSFLYNGEEAIGNDEYDWGGGMFYFAQINGGDTFEFDVEQYEVETGSIIVYVSGLDQTDGIYLADKYGMEFVEENLPEGYSDVTFTSLQTPLLLGVKSFKGTMSNDNVFAYLNNERISYDWGWNVDCRDGDVLKVYVANSTPERYTVTYSCDVDGFTPEIREDYSLSVSAPSTRTVLPGTIVTIEENSMIKSVKVNDEMVEPTDGIYAFYINGDTNVKISKDDLSGIEGIANDAAGRSEIYNLQGIRMSKDVKSLPAGIYIINGQKVRIK